MSQSEFKECSRPSSVVLAALFSLALAWSVCLRVPLVLNASAHLDSDLAVDGLVLAHAVKGEYRWHYPGTPHSGIVPVLLSLPQSFCFGANPKTLVSGGVVAYALLAASVFATALVSFGRRVAAWTLGPIAVGSTGLVWLSGRITGGHLLAAAWFAFALTWLFYAVNHSKIPLAALFGFWCGLGFYIDRMFAVGAIAMGFAAGVGWARQRKAGRLCALLASVLVGFAIGAAPSEIGKRVDPYDAYPGQFELALSPDSISRHFQILATQCFPRLVSGHRLPDGLPLPALGEVQGVSLLSTLPRTTSIDAVIAWFLALSAMAGMAGLLINIDWRRENPASGAVRLSMLLACFGSVITFVVNKNIFGSDNYRYLVLLIPAWFIGFGVMLDKLANRGSGNKALAWALLALTVSTSTIDAYRWNLRLGWISPLGFPITKHVEEPVLDWIKLHPKVRVIKGGYWDVYRLAFLSGRDILGVPTGNYPDRFPSNQSAAARRSTMVWIVHAQPPGGFSTSAGAPVRRRVQFQPPNYLFVEGN